MNSLLTFPKSTSVKIFSSVIKSLRGITSANILQKNESQNCCPPCGFYPKEVECKINEQIALEFVAFYNFLAMFNHFSRSDVGLKGCKNFFQNCAEDERRHALKLCNYQTSRGGVVNLMDIEKPVKLPCNVRDAFNYSLQIEKKITEKLIELKNIARTCDDSVTHDLIVNDFIKHQYNTIHELTGYLAKLELLKSCESGIYEFDRDLEKSLRKYSLD